MNREIKFRAWDSKFNVMLPNVVVYDSRVGCIGIVDVAADEAYGDLLDDRMDIDFEGSVPEWYSWTGGFEIMQYTGLKDKNGVDIYEGDIVKWTERTGEGRITYKSPVEYEHDCFCISGYQRNNQGLYARNHECEIIGNIYQSPELINPHHNETN